MKANAFTKAGAIDVQFAQGNNPNNTYHILLLANGAIVRAERVGPYLWADGSARLNSGTIRVIWNRTYRNAPDADAVIEALRGQRDQGQWADVAAHVHAHGREPDTLPQQSQEERQEGEHSRAMGKLLFDLPMMEMAVAILKSQGATWNGVAWEAPRDLGEE